METTKKQRAEVLVPAAVRAANATRSARSMFMDKLGERKCCAAVNTAAIAASSV